MKQQLVGEVEQLEVDQQQLSDWPQQEPVEYFEPSLRRSGQY